MGIAALYDIHGNLPALEAVLREIRAGGVDQVVVGGDVVPGPMSREMFECLLNLNEIFTRLTPEERLAPVFAGITASVVVCGHTHMQFDRMAGGVRVVNAGSVGMPFGEPGAYWLLLGPGVELRHTAYDLASAAQRIRQTDYPDAEQFAAKYVLHPPAEKEMLELFSRAESKGPK
jgi:predicted phosphodiesterase